MEKSYKIVVASGRRELVYRIDAETSEQAMERWTKYLAFTGTVVCTPFEVVEDGEGHA